MHVYSGTYDTVGEAIVGGWNRFVAEVWVTVRDAVAPDKTALPAFAPHVGPRGADDPDPTITLAYLDLDALANDAALGALIDRVTELGLEALIHTTPSDRGPGTSPRKVRLWAPLDRPAMPHECATLRLELADALGVVVDPSTLDAKRVGFAGRIVGSEPRLIWHLRGAPVPVGEPTPVPVPHAAPAPAPTEVDAGWIAGAVAQLAQHMVLGQHHRMALGLGGYCASRGIPEEQAVTLIRCLPTDNPDRQEATVRDAYSGKARVAGWSILAEVVPQADLPALERAVPNPRLVADLAERAAVKAANAPRGLPDVESQFGDATDPMVNLYIRGLAGCGSLYQRGGRIVEVNADRDMSIHDVVGARLTEVVGVVVGGHALKSVGMIAARGHWPGMRDLDGITRTPTLRPDGTVLDRDGYDEQTRTLARLDLVPHVGTTHADAVTALAVLRELVCDFPFEAEIDFAAWVAGVLTPLARAAIDGPAPLLLLEANDRGAGKTLLATLIGLICSGAPVSPTALPRTKEETDKTLFSLIRGARPVVLLDNVTREVQSDVLEACLTSPDQTYEGRVLGESRTERVVIRTTFLVTANNARVSSDLVRRSIRCNLRTDLDAPAERTGFVNPDLTMHTATERATYLGAALTILRAYAAAGRPAQDTAAIGSFGRWSRVVRDAIVWAGGADVVATQKPLREASDEEGALLRELHRAWRDRLGDTEVTSRGALEAAGMVEGAVAVPDVAAMRGLADALGTILGPRVEPSPIALGRALRRYVDRPVEGFALTTHQDPHLNRQVWALTATGRARP